MHQSGKLIIINFITIIIVMNNNFPQLGSTHVTARRKGGSGIRNFGVLLKVGTRK